MRHVAKVPWSGTLVSVQARIRLTRSFDQRSHSYQGYVLGLRGAIGDERREFLVAIGKAAQAKHRFKVGDEASGVGVPVADPRLETAELYKVSKLKLQSTGPEVPSAPPPWQAAPLELSELRARGHRRLAKRTYDTQCTTCIWGCQMPVEMIVDHWNPSQRRYRFETFCYGPLSCPRYKAGPTRKVPGRRGMSWEEADWVDDEAVAYRGPDPYELATKKAR
jgi:hypothetical protein